MICVAIIFSEEKMKNRKNFIKVMTESAVMIALASVLSMLPLVDMPYGGSVTLASMLPIALIAYRHGISAGFGAGFVFAAVQQLLGLKNLSYVTGWQSVVAVILLDYIAAFTVLGLCGIFKGRLGLEKLSPETRQGLELTFGMLTACVIRYIFHTVAGATVWAGLSIPTEAALIYSLGYNATYMIPETVVNAVAAFYIGSVINLLKAIPTRFSPSTRVSGESAVALSGILIKLGAILFAATAVIDTVILFPHLQDPKDGSFTFAHLSQMDPTAIIIVSAVGILLSVGAIIAAAVLRSKAKNKQ